MATNIFLRIEGIAGESRDAAHPNEIELLSWSWGASNAASATTGTTTTTSRAAIQEIVFAAHYSKASPLLFLGCASAQRYKSARLAVVRAGATPQEFLVLTLTDVAVASYQTTASQDDAPLDSVALSFGRVLIEYRPQRPDGTLDTPVRVGWDVRANTKF